MEQLGLGLGLQRAKVVVASLVPHSGSGEGVGGASFHRLPWHSTQKQEALMGALVTGLM